jgi:hypothetical protein
MQCRAAMLDFIWLYMQTVEQRSAGDCARLLQSQFRAIEQAHAILTSLAMRLANTGSDVSWYRTVELIQECDFCATALAQWTAMVASVKK